MTHTERQKADRKSGDFTSEHTLGQTDPEEVALFSFHRVFWMHVIWITYACNLTRA